MNRVCIGCLLLLLLVATLASETIKYYLDYDEEVPKDQAIGKIHKEAKYDDNGHFIESIYLGENGEPILDRLCGIHKEKYDYDTRGNLQSITYWGIKGEPIKDTFLWVHKRVYEHDENGNLLMVTYYDTEDHPTNNHYDGVFCEQYTYDQYGNQITENYIKANGKPGRKFGRHRAEKTYDTRFPRNPGRPEQYRTSISEYDENDRLVLKYVSTFDDHGNMTSWSNFGFGGEAELDFSWVHQYKMSYDEENRLTSMSCFGIEHEAILDKNDIHLYQLAYDDDGNRTTRFFGKFMEQVPLYRDIHYIELTCNKDTKKWSEALYDTDDKKLPYGSYLLPWDESEPGIYIILNPIHIPFP